MNAQRIRKWCFALPSIAFAIASWPSTDAFAQSDPPHMAIGTNFWFLAPQWSGETPWIWPESTNPSVQTSEYVPDQPYTNRINPWNDVFLAETAHYTVLRFMDWGKTNNSGLSRWSERVLPDNKDNFSANKIAASGGPLPGLAYEWMIDLCNRQDADLWICIPHAADDDFVTNLAELIHDNLEPQLNVYVEYSNEVWNFAGQQNYCAAQAQAIGLGEGFDGAMKYQAYRSAEVWDIFENAFDGETERVINVMAGKSTSPWITENLHLSSLFDQGFNPTGSLPEAYAIAPYFGGNGLNGDDSQIWQKLRQDIFEQRPAGSNGAGSNSRMENVRDHYDVAVNQYGIDLIAYEGGQHVGENALDPNRDPRMYELYIDYLDALAPYLSLFAHYTHVGSFSEGGCWGAKEFTGQPASEAHKFRALYDWAEANQPPVISGPMAVAGTNQSIVDDDGSGAEQVWLDGSGSSHTDGAALSYEWRYLNEVVGDEARLLILLPEGYHNLSLTVRDPQGRSDTDSVAVTVRNLAVGPAFSGSGATGSILAGASPGTSASFFAQGTTGSSNYFVLSIVSESAAVTSASFAGDEMDLLYAANTSGTAHVAFYGIMTSQTSGQVSVDFGSNFYGGQIFGYAFLDHVDVNEPVRARGASPRSNGSSTLALSFDGPVADGDIALVASYINGNNHNVTITPNDVTLFSGKAGASFCGAVVVDADLNVGSYSSQVRFTNNDRDRQLLAGIVLAINAVVVDQVTDFDGDGYSDAFEEFFNIDSRAPNSEGLPMRVEKIGRQTRLVFNRSRSTAPPLLDLYWSPDLDQWYPSEAPLRVLEDHGSYQELAADSPLDEPRVFWRFAPSND